MKLSIFHGIAAAGIGLAAVGIIDNWIARMLGIILLSVGLYVSWVHRAEFGERDD